MTKLLRTVVVLLIINQLFLSCTPSKEVQEPILQPGIWRGVLTVQNQELPFNFTVGVIDSTYSLNITNGEERLLLDEVIFTGDSVTIPMHIFDADIVAKVYRDSLVGYWIKHYSEDYIIPFTAYHNNDKRFIGGDSTNYRDFSGKFSTTFINESKDTVNAVADFKQEGNTVTGTFITPNGDYRYLEGIAYQNQLSLSAFDGGHAFLFSAIMNQDRTLSGDFWSGKSWHETWTAYKNDSASVPDISELTYLKEGYSTVDFEFPDVNGNLVSPSDDKYKGKVLVLQLFGTWCPNCMDESKFLSKWYKENHERGVEILGLSYEVKDDFEYASKRLKRVKEKLGVGYDYVIAGTSSKKAASESLPMLSEIISFPTLIFLDKTGKVRKIHSGFKGPGSGDSYEYFVKDFNNAIDELVNE